MKNNMCLATKRLLIGLKNQKTKLLGVQKSGQAAMGFSNGFEAKRTNPLRITKRSKDSESSSSEFFNFKKMKSKNAQAAMEFLMTYGWAILVVLIAISALAYFGVLNPSKFLPESCTLAPGLGCTDFKANGSEINLVIVNGLGQSLTNISINLSDGCSNSISGDSLDDGEEKQFNVSGCSFTTGERLKEGIIIAYDSEAGIRHLINGELITKVE